jgi:hypothetical protein
MKIHQLCCIAAVGLVITISADGKEDKLKPEELVAKHLASIGNAEALSAVRSRAAEGQTQLIFRLGAHGQLNGPATMVSEGQKVYVGMMFPVLDYRWDDTGYIAPRNCLPAIPHHLKIVEDFVDYKLVPGNVRPDDEPITIVYDNSKKLIIK